MKNKVLVEVFFVQLDEKFDIFISLNKNIANTIELICKAIGEYKRIDNINYKTLSLYRADTSLKYEPSIVILNSNIRNGTRLILM